LRLFFYGLIGRIPPERPEPITRQEYAAVRELAIQAVIDLSRIRVVWE
jgi:hypothetical protein